VPKDKIRQWAVSDRSGEAAEKLTEELESSQTGLLATALAGVQLECAQPLKLLARELARSAT
jgi:hypothetical protein